MRHSKVFRSFYCHNTNDNKGFLKRRILNALRKRKKEKFSIVVVSHITSVNCQDIRCII